MKNKYQITCVKCNWRVPIACASDIKECSLCNSKKDMYLINKPHCQECGLEMECSGGSTGSVFKCICGFEEWHSKINGHYGLFNGKKVELKVDKICMFFHDWKLNEH